MGLYIKNWSLADWKELLKWAKIGANNAMIGEFAEVEEVPPHGDLIDKSGVEVLSWYEKDEGDFCDGVLFVLDKLDELPVIIPAEEGD